MENLIPQKLKKGDEIRIVAPSTGIKIIGKDCRQIAKERFEALGLKVSFGRYTTDDNFDEMGSSSIENRAADIMDAFKDKNVKAIFTIIGGFNSNQILPFLDYEIIKQNPKIICGFSDITALLNGIRAKTGLLVFYGPHYSSIGMKKGCDYTFEMMRDVL
ncbi:MAG: LD-carboxypeptidase, partial [Alphaproteobacteria bacterium]|nr:LD-carboxypeptidase [Alphaproteobacteria bacterium]